MEFLPKFNFYNLEEGIFLVELENPTHLALAFLRSQEFYHSINDNFRGKSFNLEDYKKWYTEQSSKKEFSYPEDWEQFQVAGHTIDSCYRKSNELLPPDDFILQISALCSTISKKKGLHSYCLLGIRSGQKIKIDYSLALGLFHTNSKYKMQMLELLAKMKQKKPNLIKDLSAVLQHMGYHAGVHLEKSQAFLATGLHKKMLGIGLDKVTEEFEAVYKTFNKNWKLNDPYIKNIR